MPAHATQKYDGFLLDERRLRKLVDILESRLKAAAIPSQIRFDVYRSDHAKFTSQDVDTILREENSAATKIVGAELCLTPETPIKVLLSFRNDFGASILVEGDDRDLVFLIYSDLKTHIEGEIERRHRFLRHLTSIPALYAAIIIVLSVFPLFVDLLPTEFNRNTREYEQKFAQYEKEFENHKSKIDQARKDVSRVKYKTLVELKDKIPPIDSVTGDDLVRLMVAKIQSEIAVEEASENLDELYSYSSFPRFPEWKGRRDYLSNFTFLMMIIGVIVLLLALGREAVKRMEEQYLFLIGDEIQAYEKRRGRREKLLWSVGIAFFVSVLASIFAAMLWPPK